MSPARTRTASTSSPRQLRPARPEPSLNRRSSFPYLPGVGHAGLAYDLIIEIQDEVAVSGDVQQEAGDVFRIHLARVHRHRTRQIDRAEDQDAVPPYVGPGLRQLAVPAGFDRQVHDQDRKSTRLNSSHSQI